MGGREAIRGFAVQTLVCLFDSLSSRDEWTTVTLEPDSVNDKVDVYWEFADGSTCAQQVKSSINPIGKGQVTRWCSELKASGRAGKYQLILAGPIAQGVLANAPFDGVDVPTPTSVDTLALVDQAITKVDRYLTSKSIDPVPLPLRESLIYELVARMTQAAIYGKKMSRTEFDGWVLSTITASYPEAVNQRLTTNCAVLWSALEFAAPPDASAKSFELILPITVVNGGVSTAIVEMFLIRVSLGKVEMRYRPELVVPTGPSQDQITRRRHGQPFGDFAISPQSSIQQSVLFVPVHRVGYESGEWAPGVYEIELLVKYASQAGLSSVKKTSISVRLDEFSVFTDGKSRSISVSNLDECLKLL
jgi:hypothetical protein